MKKIFMILIYGLMMSILLVSTSALAESNASSLNASNSTQAPVAANITGNTTGITDLISGNSTTTTVPEKNLTLGNESVNTTALPTGNGTESRNVSVPSSSEWNGTVRIFHIATTEEQNKTDTVFWKLEGINAEDQANLSRLLTSYPDGSATLINEGVNATGNGFFISKKANESCTDEKCNGTPSINIWKVTKNEVSQSEPWTNGTAAIVLFPVDAEIPREMLNRENNDGAFPFFLVGDSAQITGKIGKDGSIELPCNLPNVSCSATNSSETRLYTFEQIPMGKIA